MWGGEGNRSQRFFQRKATLSGISTSLLAFSQPPSPCETTRRVPTHALYQPRTACGFVFFHSFFPGCHPWLIGGSFGSWMRLFPATRECSFSLLSGRTSPSGGLMPPGRKKYGACPSSNQDGLYLNISNHPPLSHSADVLCFPSGPPPPPKCDRARKSLPWAGPFVSHPQEMAWPGFNFENHDTEHIFLSRRFGECAS